jgi:hypothetical protein
LAKFSGKTRLATAKSKVRTSKSQADHKLEISDTNRLIRRLRILDFGFTLDFALRISNLSRFKLPLNQQRKKKPSAVAGKVSSLFRGLSWSQGRNSEFVKRGDNQRARPRNEWSHVGPAGVTKSYFFFFVVFLVVFLAAFFFAIASYLLS